MSVSCFVWSVQVPLTDIFLPLSLSCISFLLSTLLLLFLFFSPSYLFFWLLLPLFSVFSFPLFHSSPSFLSFFSSYFFATYSCFLFLLSLAFICLFLFCFSSFSSVILRSSRYLCFCCSLFVVCILLPSFIFFSSYACFTSLPFFLSLLFSLRVYFMCNSACSPLLPF